KIFVHNLVDYLLKVETLVTKDVKEIYLTGKLSWFDQEKNSNLDFPDDKDVKLIEEQNDISNVSDIIKNNEPSDNISDPKKSEKKDLSEKNNNS
ncbi:MAG: cell division protein FtsH, partial [Sweet potato little leaf phytoplasma]|nr:cell division protein FtsH [Sweet potato little leaf phytoplasma]